MTGTRRDREGPELLADAFDRMVEYGESSDEALLKVVAHEIVAREAFRTCEEIARYSFIISA